jgi:hypothetical protein
VAGEIAFGKPTRLGHAQRRYAEVSNLLLTRSTEFIDVTGPTSLLPRTNFCRIKSACLSSSINADHSKCEAYNRVYEQPYESH